MALRDAMLADIDAVRASLQRQRDKRAAIPHFRVSLADSAEVDVGKLLRDWHAEVRRMC